MVKAVALDILEYPYHLWFLKLKTAVQLEEDEQCKLSSSCLRLKSTINASFAFCLNKHPDEMSFDSEDKKERQPHQCQTQLQTQ